MEKRERFEWCNFWWDEDGDGAGRRLLLVGDSIASGYRPFLTELLQDTFRVDMLATSKAADNPGLVTELDYVIRCYSYDYEIIHFNNGLHGRHLSAAEYGKWYERAVEHLIGAMPDSRIILAYTTPRLLTEPACVPTPKFDPLPEQRNGVVREIASTRNFEIDDLYTPFAEKFELFLDDGVHFGEEGRKAQARLVAKIVSENP